MHQRTSLFWSQRAWSDADMQQETKWKCTAHKQIQVTSDLHTTNMSFFSIIQHHTFCDFPQLKWWWDTRSPYGSPTSGLRPRWGHGTPRIQHVCVHNLDMWLVVGSSNSLCILQLAFCSQMFCCLFWTVRGCQKVVRIYCFEMSSENIIIPVRRYVALFLDTNPCTANGVWCFRLAQSSSAATQKCHTTLPMSTCCSQPQLVFVAGVVALDNST